MTKLTELMESTGLSADELKDAYYYAGRAVMIHCLNPTIFKWIHVPARSTEGADESHETPEVIVWAGLVPDNHESLPLERLLASTGPLAPMEFLLVAAAGSAAMWLALYPRRKNPPMHAAEYSDWEQVEEYFARANSRLWGLDTFPIVNHGVAQCRTIFSDQRIWAYVETIAKRLTPGAVITHEDLCEIFKDVDSAFEESRKTAA